MDEWRHRKKISRKDFLKLAVTAAGATVTAGIVKPEEGIAKEETSPPGVDLSKLPQDILKKNELLRMQDELATALKKPLKERKWSMVLDLRKCIGCSACTVGCIAENVLPPGVVYRPVIEEEFGDYPNVGRRFTPMLCNHCDNLPVPCIAACPVKATLKRPDGIVDIDYNKCIGCGYCIVACPYHARQKDHGEFYTKNTPKIEEYELRPTYEYNKRWPRKKRNSPIGNARKCHFCIHRIERGLLPACVVTCIGNATYFGDLNDKDSMVNELAAKPNAVVLKPEYGTRPRVYYLI